MFCSQEREHKYILAVLLPVKWRQAKRFPSLVRVNKGKQFLYIPTKRVENKRAGAHILYSPSYFLMFPRWEGKQRGKYGGGLTASVATQNHPSASPHSRNEQ